jgi:hypothetical protein
MIWAFVDYENVGSLATLNISEYERIFVFCGLKNTRIKVGELPSSVFCRIELIGFNHNRIEQPGLSFGILCLPVS